MTVYMKAVPEPTAPRTRAIIANTIAENVDTTAASCGLLPKGEATKNDQLASDRPRRRWTTKIRPAFVALKIRKCHTKETMSHAGK